MRTYTDNPCSKTGRELLRLLLLEVGELEASEAVAARPLGGEVSPPGLGGVLDDDEPFDAVPADLGTDRPRLADQLRAIRRMHGHCPGCGLEFNGHSFGGLCVECAQKADKVEGRP